MENPNPFSAPASRFQQSESALDGCWLLVDDSDAFRERLAQALRERGFEVATAANYDQAMRIAEATECRRAVVDLKMPGRSGLELLRDLKQVTPDIEVLMLTGFGSIATAIDAVRLGAVNFLPKPADADDILLAFHRAHDSASPAAGQVEFETPQEAPSLARAEWEHIHRVLADSDGNISEAARRLGIHRRSLQRKLRKLAPE